ncbi:hypothetical protein HD806DRAFT_551116 [Xylariaceae sp. AK1471]|nr:hypothetical protein HD806DRAFT_551116 [Xylariaceae sp. AK1471]
MSEQMDSAKWADDTFHKVISILKQNGLYRASPKFFILYAHENDKLQIEANKKLVTDYISWFKELLFNVNSDKSPHGYQPANSLADEGRSITGASTDIIHNQLCLLPQGWHGGNVDYILVFYSELLAQYMHDEREFKSKHNGQTYSEALFNECVRYDPMVQDSWEQVCEAIRQVQKAYRLEMGDKFHHAMTEMALLGFRNSRGIQSAIPILLFDDENGPTQRKWQSSHLRMADTVIRLQYRPGEEHRLFFKILKEFETLKDAVQILDELEKCYEESVNLLQTERMTSEEYCTKRESKISGTLKNLNDAGYLWKIERPITLGSIREILNLHSRIDHASIKRISGQKLPVNLSDISLAVAKCPGSSDKHKAKRKTEPSEKRRLVLLHGLFDEIKLGHDKIRPKRVLIQGRPGIGKTTLSRIAMYEYSWNHELQKRFDLVVRIPVRKLEQLDHLTQVLYDEYFQVTARGDEFAKQLSEIILDKCRLSAKLLIILDGLDEARQWSEEKLEKLMNRHVIMITSRSYETGLSSIDLHLEALGLTMASIEAYVRNTEIIPSHIGKDILAFIQHKPYIKEMLRVPILLDILCYSWDEFRRHNTPSNATQGGEGHDLPTMTYLYQAIVRTLWRRDIPQLDKRDHGERVTLDIVNAVRDVSRLERVVCAESNLLGEIGINMMKSDRVEFGDDTISEAIQRSETKGMLLPLSLERNISKLSFIHLDDRGQQHQFRFVHRTFQEYFAAQWLTEHREHLKEYLREHKYNRRFENVWRFVAGMLQAKKKEEHLLDFFSGIEEEPRDLLGPRHQRLIMRCLSEMSSEQKTPFNLLRSNLEGRLYE